MSVARLCLPLALAPLLWAAGCSLVAGNSEMSERCLPACSDGSACVGGRCVVETKSDENLLCVEGSETSICPDDMRCVFGRCESALRCVDTDCPDGFSCAPDGYCRETVACASDAECDDGVFCSGVERCDQDTGECAIGTPPCTAEAPICQEDLGACHECSVDAECDNGNFCDGMEVCSAGFCTTSAEPQCPFGCNVENNRCRDCSSTEDCASDPCVDGVFECSAKGECEFVREGCAPTEICDPEGGEDGGLVCYQCDDDADCDNGLRCDGREECTDNVCVTIPSTVDPCADNDDEPNCIEEEGGDGFDCSACIDDADCDDGQFCNGTEFCDTDNGRCRYEFGDRDPPDSRVCSDPDLSACSEDDDGCFFCVDDDDCGDGDPCTVDRCVDRTRCESEPKCPGEACWAGACGPCSFDAQCDDGSFCNGAEACEYVWVIFGPDRTRCIDRPNPCGGNTPFCSEASNRCFECEVQSHCLDNNRCNGIESCNNGFCQGGVPVQCDEGETCQPQTGNCIEDPPPPEPDPTPEPSPNP